MRSHELFDGEDSPAHFDPLAALAVKNADGSHAVTMDEAVGVDYTAFQFEKNPLPWRACAPGCQPPNANKQMGFRQPPCATTPTTSTLAAVVGACRSAPWGGSDAGGTKPAGNPFSDGRT
jgi:hypothetical protein